MSKYRVTNNILMIDCPCNISDFDSLSKLLDKRKIDKVSVNAPIDLSILYLLKRALPKEVKVLNFPEGQVNNWENIRTELPNEEHNQEGHDSHRPFQIHKLFSLRSNTKPQDRFWLSMFWNSFFVLTIENIFLISAIFFGIGVAISFIVYHEFFRYAIELESCKIVVYAGVKILCPMMTNFVITAKSCSALSAVIKAMSIDTEFKIMSLVNLPYYRVYLHPIFFASMIAGPIMNLLAIGATIAGAVSSWVLQGHPASLFFSLVQTDFSWSYIFDSEIRALLCSFFAGLATCYAGMRRGQSFYSMIDSISYCVTLSALTNIIVQALMSIFF